MLNFCIFVFIIYAVASSVKAILNGSFLENVLMFLKAFKSTESQDKKSEQKSKIVRINRCNRHKKVTKIPNQSQRAA